METVYLVCAVAGGTILVVQTILLMIGGDADSGHDGSFDGGHDLAGDGVAGDDVGSHDFGHDAAARAGHGHDSVAASDAHEAAYLKVLSFKTLVAFATFFGLGGLASLRGGLENLPALFVALGAGSVALYLVAYLMKSLSRLQSRGNVSLANAIGLVGKVYLRVPGERSGVGKVHVVVQGRLVECRATTAGPEIPTGAQARVISVAGPNTLEVVPAGKE